MILVTLGNLHLVNCTKVQSSDEFAYKDIFKKHMTRTESEITCFLHDQMSFFAKFHHFSGVEINFQIRLVCLQWTCIEDAII